MKIFKTPDELLVPPTQTQKTFGDILGIPFRCRYSKAIAVVVRPGPWCLPPALSVKEPLVWIWLDDPGHAAAWTPAAQVFYSELYELLPDAVLVTNQRVCSDLTPDLTPVEYTLTIRRT